MCCGAKQTVKESKISVGREEINLSQNRRNIFNVVLKVQKGQAGQKHF